MGGGLASPLALRRPTATAGADDARLVTEAAEGIRAVVRNRDLTLIMVLAVVQTFTRGR